MIKDHQVDTLKQYFIDGSGKNSEICVAQTDAFQIVRILNLISVLCVQKGVKFKMFLKN